MRTSPNWDLHCVWCAEVSGGSSVCNSVHEWTSSSRPHLSTGNCSYHICFSRFNDKLKSHRDSGMISAIGHLSPEPLYTELLHSLYVPLPSVLRQLTGAPETIRHG